MPRSPSVSTRRGRVRPRTFLAGAVPTAPPPGPVATRWLSMTPARGFGSCPNAIRRAWRKVSTRVRQGPLSAHVRKRPETLCPGGKDVVSIRQEMPPRSTSTIAVETSRSAWTRGRPWCAGRARIGAIRPPGASSTAVGKASAADAARGAVGVGVVDALSEGTNSAWLPPRPACSYSRLMASNHR